MDVIDQPQIAKSRVLIAGGGIAGIETLLALRDLAGNRAEITLVAAEPEFIYKPLIVEEPFGAGPAERHALAPAVDELGGRFVLGVVKRVRPDQRRIAVTEGGEGARTGELEYDLLVACMAADGRPTRLPSQVRTALSQIATNGAGPAGTAPWATPRSRHIPV